MKRMIYYEFLDNLNNVIDKIIHLFKAPFEHIVNYIASCHTQPPKRMGLIYQEIKLDR